jgi:cutinase
MADFRVQRATMRPRVCKLLKNEYKDRVGCQGVGEDYEASIIDNMSPAGTSQAAIEYGIELFSNATIKCPSSVIVFGGYR